MRIICDCGREILDAPIAAPGSVLPGGEVVGRAFGLYVKVGKNAADGEVCRVQCEQCRRVIFCVENAKNEEIHPGSPEVPADQLN